MSLRAYLIELVGTLLLVFFSAGILCAARMVVKDGAFPIGLVGIALAQGAALAVILWFTTRVSQGCLNPAMTLALWVTRRFDFGRCFTLILVQMIGAVFGGLLVFAVFPQDALQDAFVGTPHLYDFYKTDVEVRPGHWVIGTAVEVVLTFLLTLALLTSVLDPQRAERPWAPLVPGLALTACVLVGYHLSGASLNPARWWGTAVWQKNLPVLDALPVLRDHLPYWMGPIVGALLAGIVHAEWLRPDAAKKG